MPIIGLDLGEHSFRAIEIEKKKGINTILNFGHFENPRLSKGSMEENKDVYIRALKDFFSEIGFSTPEVVVGLSESSIFMRILKFPNLNDKDLSTAIQHESEQYIPIPLDQVNMSYQKLNATPDGKMINVQLVAAKKQKLEEYVGIVRSAGLVPKAMEPETLAISQALIDPDDQIGTVILDIGFTNSIIVVVQEGFVQFTRTIPIGGELITKAIQQKLNLEYIQAEEYKKVYGMDQSHFDGKIYEVIKPMIDNIIAETKRATIFFTNSNPNANMKRVVITGGTALMPELLVYLINNLDMEVAVGNPLKGLVFSPKAESKRNILSEYANMYATAIGLALKKV